MGDDLTEALDAFLARHETELIDFRRDLYAHPEPDHADHAEHRTTRLVADRLAGPCGHTARPHLTADVVYALGKIVTEVPAALTRRVDPRAGLSLDLVPEAMARLGTRMPGTLTTGDLHQPTFDIDESAIGIGIRVLAGTVAVASR